MLKIGWFSTGRDEAARQLLQAVQGKITSGEIKGKISFVFSNREPGESQESDLFFELVNRYRIPLVCLSSQKFKGTQHHTITSTCNRLPQWRLDYDTEAIRNLNKFDVDICVLAGYMLIVGKNMCHKYNMINLHPATPDGPKGSWQQVIWTLIEKKAKKSGVMIHLVTPELDRGPVITYCTFPITGKGLDKYWKNINDQQIECIKKREGENNSLFQLIRQYGLTREFPLIILTLASLGKGEIRIRDGKILDNQEKQIDGYDLSDKINRMIRTIK